MTWSENCNHGAPGSQRAAVNRNMQESCNPNGPYAGVTTHPDLCNPGGAARPPRLLSAFYFWCSCCLYSQEWWSEQKKANATLSSVQTIPLPSPGPGCWLRDLCCGPRSLPALGKRRVGLCTWESTRTSTHIRRLGHKQRLDSRRIFAQRNPPMLQTGSWQREVNGNQPMGNSRG